MPRRLRFTYRHQYDLDDEEKHGAECAITCEDPSLTQQSFAIDADINTIVKRFGIRDGSQIPVGITDPQYYGDFSEATDFRGAIDRIRDAQERFAMLPADLRSRFDNDPVKLYGWVSNPENAEAAVELGLLAKTHPPAATPPSPPGPPDGGGTAA